MKAERLVLGLNLEMEGDRSVVRLQVVAGGPPSRGRRCGTVLSSGSRPETTLMVVEAGTVVYRLAFVIAYQL